MGDPEKKNQIFFIPKYFLILGNQTTGRKNLIENKNQNRRALKIPELEACLFVDLSLRSSTFPLTPTLLDPSSALIRKGPLDFKVMAESPLGRPENRNPSFGDEEDSNPVGHTSNGGGFPPRAIMSHTIKIKTSELKNY